MKSTKKGFIKLTSYYVAITMTTYYFAKFVFIQKSNVYKVINVIKANK